MSQSEKITVVSAHMECGMCPTTIIGKTSDGWTVYARYRWGMLSVRLDPRDPVPNCGAEGTWILSKQLDPDSLDGCLYYDELKEHTAEILEWPDELSPKIHDENDTWLDNL